MFIDYIEVSQYHHPHPPEFHAGLIFRAKDKTQQGGFAEVRAEDYASQQAVEEFLGVDGTTHSLRMMSISHDVEVCEAAAMRKHEGSYSTSLQIKSKDGWVRVKGNPSRFGRLDNLFGFELDECMSVINEQLRAVGLPPFTIGEVIAETHNSQRESLGLDIVNDEEPDGMGNGEAAKWSGARFARIDATENMYAGSDFLAKLCIRNFQGRCVGYMKKHAFGEETVMWTNTRRCIKAYRKGPDMKKHCPLSPWSVWADDVGVVRFEVELKSRYLSDTGLCYWGNCSMAKIYELFKKETEVFRRVDCSLDPHSVETVSPKARLVYASWLKGEDVRSLLPRATFYRHRRTLQDEAGVDIAEVRSVGADVVPMVRVIDLREAQPPKGYIGGSEFADRYNAALYRLSVPKHADELLDWAEAA